MVNAASPYCDLKSFIDASRAQPDKLTMTSADPGTTSEVGVKLFVAQTGAAVRQIPSATAAQLSDPLGGHVDSMMENLPPLIGNLKRGTPARAGRHHPAACGVQSGRAYRGRAGLPDYEQSAWSAGGAGRHAARRAGATNDALNQALRTDNVVRESRSRSQEPLGGAPQDAGADQEGIAPMGEHHQGRGHHARLTMRCPMTTGAPA